MPLDTPVCRTQAPGDHGGGAARRRRGRRRGSPAPLGGRPAAHATPASHATPARHKTLERSPPRRARASAEGKRERERERLEFHSLFSRASRRRGDLRGRGSEPHVGAPRRAAAPPRARGARGGERPDAALTSASALFESHNSSSKVPLLRSLKLSFFNLSIPSSHARSFFSSLSQGPRRARDAPQRRGGAGPLRARAALRARGPRDDASIAERRRRKTTSLVTAARTGGPRCRGRPRRPFRRGRRRVRRRGHW